MGEGAAERQKEKKTDRQKKLANTSQQYVKIASTLNKWSPRQECKH
jgi:hypothetical protein